MILFPENVDCSSPEYIQSVLRKSYEGCFQMRAHEFQNSFVGEIEDKKKLFSINKVSRLLIDYEAHRTGSLE